MTEHRAKGANLHKPADGQFGMNWAYEANHCPAEEIFAPGFFNAQRGNMRTGDSVRAIRIVDGHVREVAEGIVLHVDAKDVIVAKGFVVSFDPPETKETEGKEAKGEGFVQGSGEVKWNAGKKVHEVHVEGAVVFATKDKDLAQSVARGDVPVPEPEIA
jgi:hypothetical protein